MAEIIVKLDLNKQKHIHKMHRYFLRATFLHTNFISTIYSSQLIKFPKHCQQTFVSHNFEASVIIFCFCYE